MSQPSRLARLAALLLGLACFLAVRAPTAHASETGPSKRPRPERTPGVDERQVLLEAAAILSEDPSSQLASWSADNPDDHCLWEGVNCSDDGRVIELELHGGGLAGRVPPVLGMLDQLYTLNLANNKLGGTIPAELGACSRLALLDLSNNRLTGAIPPELAITHIMDIYLSNNLLSGTMPSEFSSLHDLLNLYLDDNKLTGTIPTEFSALAWTIEEFAVQNNYLTGNLEEQLQSLGWWWSEENMERLEFYPQHSMQ